MKHSSSSGSKRGRPKAPRDISRPNRIVTFVTDKERELLEQHCKEDDRSMAAAVHRIIKAHFEERGDLD
jgi:hypothetical protein